MTAGKLATALARIQAGLLALLLIILISQIVGAESVTIGGSEAVGTVERLLMTGGVVVTHDEWTLQGDTAVYDKSASTFTVSGNVQLMTPDGTFSGSKAAYNWADGRVVFDDGVLETTVAGSSEPVLIRAAMITIDDTSALFDASIVTACDLEEPHWYLKCGSAELHPSDKLVLRRVTFYEAGMPLFWWPYLVLPLGEGKLPQLPVIGYTAETGLYASVSTRYGDESSGGTLQLDVQQKAGMGAGLKHDMRLSEQLTATGSAYLFRYWVGESYWAEIAGGLSGRIVNGMEVSASVSYRPYLERGSLSKDEVRAKASINYSQSRTELSAAYELIGATLPLGFASQSLGGSIKHSLSERVELEARTSIVDKSGYGSDSTTVDDIVVNYSAKLKSNLERGTVGVLLEDWTDYTASTYSIARKKRLVKAPELSLQGLDVRVPWTSQPLRLDVSVGNYSYWPSGSADPNTGSRVLVNARQSATRVVESERFALSYSLAAGYRRYGSGDQLAYVAPQATAETTHERLKATLTYGLTEVYGHTPLVFDEVKHASKLTLNTSYGVGHVTATVQSSYDFSAQKFDPVAFWLRYSPDQKLALDLSYSYDITNRRPYSMVLRYDDRRDENKTLRMGVNYSLESMSVKRAEAEISYKLTDTLKLATAVSYDGEKNQWNRGDVALIADLHCREVGLRYDIGQGRVWLEYRLYTFPSEPVKLGLGDEEGVLLESSLFTVE